MRSKSPELMSEIKKYIEDYYLQNRQSPSTTKLSLIHIYSTASISSFSSGNSNLRLATKYLL